MKTFPEYELKEGSVQRTTSTYYQIQIDSNVRKKYNNKWYLIPFIIRYEHPINNDLDFARCKEEALQEFMKYGYRYLIMYKIDAALKLDKEGEGRWGTNVTLDTDQRSEYDRLNNIVRYKKLLFV